MNDIKLSSITHNSVGTLKPSDSVKDAFISMRENSISSVVVTDINEKPIGIFTEHDAIGIIARQQQNTTLLSDVMSHGVFYLNTETHIHDAYILMEQKGYRHIVVVDDNEKYLGVVSEGDFIRHMGFGDVSKSKKIEDAMNDSILTVSPDKLLTEIAMEMSKLKCDYAIVLNDLKPLGIIQERDLAHYCLDKSLTNENAMSIARQDDLHLVHKSTSLQKASVMMQEHSIHQLIVVDDDDMLIGLIDRHKILKSIHTSYFDYLIQTIQSKSANEVSLEKHKKELEKLANYDQLTNLPNRLFFQTYLKKSVAKAIRNKRTLAVLMLDLDRFKDINDSYGHSIGDEILTILSKRILLRIREGDLVARLGGDEFAIILEDLTYEDDVTKVANSILETISETCKLSNGIELHVEASVGIIIAPKNAQTVEQILQYADSALYQAKNNGRGALSFYTDEMTKKAMQKVAYENALRKAVENNELELYYQPQVHIHTGRIVSAEALLRWNHPENGMVSPNVFIPIAEETGLINLIGEWVINEACVQGVDWHNKGYNLTLAVNVSPNQVKYQNLPAVITKALKNSDYPANKLEVEITESSLMQREEEVVEMLHSLRAKGIRLAIDDFGTGYSSLSYLKRFPIDVIKIDKSFIDDVPYDKDDMAIVKAIIEMGKALDFQILAEGAEHKEQVDFLRDNGCEFFQGFYKSKPLPTKEFEELLLDQQD